MKPRKWTNFPNDKQLLSHRARVKPRCIQFYKTTLKHKYGIDKALRTLAYSSTVLWECKSVSHFRECDLVKKITCASL